MISPPKQHESFVQEKWSRFGRANVHSEMKRILFSLLSYLQHYFVALYIIKTAYSDEADSDSLDDMWFCQSDIYVTCHFRDE